MLKTLISEIKRDEDKQDLRSIVLTSVLGKVFSAGHNLKELVCRWNLWFRFHFWDSSRHLPKEEKTIISLHCLDSYQQRVSQRSVRRLFEFDESHQPESSTGDRGGGRFGSCGWLSIGRSVWHRSLHGKKFVLHSRVFCEDHRFVISLYNWLIIYYLVLISQVHLSVKDVISLSFVTCASARISEYSVRHRAYR